MIRQDQVAAEIHVHVFGYREDGVWYAHAWEMDIIASGPSFEEAASELEVLVQAQVNFAAFRRNPGLLWHPAPKEVAAKFYGALLYSQARTDLEREAGLATSLTIPPPFMIAQNDSNQDA